MILAAECTAHCSTLQSYVGLMTDVPHIAFELTLEAVTGIAIYPLARRLLRAYRDRIHREIDAEHGYMHEETHVHRGDRVVHPSE